MDPDLIWLVRRVGRLKPSAAFLEVVWFDSEESGIRSLAQAASIQTGLDHAISPLASKTRA